MSQKSLVTVYTDGASRGNPGNAGIGVVLYDESGNEIAKHKKYIGLQTNNIAEYTALIESLNLLESRSLNDSKITFYSDSNLLVNQISGNFIIRNEGLRKLSLEFWRIVKKLGMEFEIIHIPREKNKVADKLANEAIDEALKAKV